MTKIHEYVERLLQDCESQYQSWLKASDAESQSKSSPFERFADEDDEPRYDSVVVEFPSADMR